MTNTAAISLQNVSKTINGKKLIQNLTFDVQRGDVYGFLGPNGAGKTTTIRMIVGLISMTEGDILINGKSIKKNRNEALKHVGAIVENPELYGFMTGRKNLIHFARMSSEPVSEKRINEIVELVDLKEAIDKRVKTYSLGMRQRLGIAQALLHRPSVLILDEPTNGLDPAGIRDLRDYLQELAKKENIAVFVSSHLLPEIELMCNRVVIIQKGQLVDECILDQKEQDNGKLPVTIEVSDVQKATELLSPFGRVVISDSKCTIDMEKEHIPAHLKLLITNGVGIYQVQTKTKTLEATFLSLTKGEKL